MGGFLGIGHSSAKTDRGNQLAGVNANWNVYNRGLPLSDALATSAKTQKQEGQMSVDDAKNYWKTLLSGNQTAVQSASAPAINAVNEAADAQKSEQAQMGTGRSGGATALNQVAEQRRMTDVDKIISGVQPKAAESLQGVGTAQTAAGQAELAQALQALGLDANVAQEIMNSSRDSRKISKEANDAVSNQWSTFLTAVHGL